MSQKPAPIKQSVCEFKRACLENPFLDLNEAHKLFILQVFSGLKKSGTFDGLSKDEDKTIEQTLRLLGALGVAYRLKDVGHNIKIFFAQEKTIAQDLYVLYDRVARSGHSRARYAELLGYPSCCIRSYVSQKKQGLLFGYLTTVFKKRIKGQALSWPVLFNRFSDLPLIFHWPCGFHCRASRDLAGRVLKLYTCYDRALAETAARLLKRPVLIFQDGSYIRFEGVYRGRTLSYGQIIRIGSSVAVEEGLSKERNAVACAVRCIARGEKILFEESTFRVINNKKVLFESRNAKNQYLLLNFN